MRRRLVILGAAFTIGFAAGALSAWRDLAAPIMAAEEPVRIKTNLPITVPNPEPRPDAGMCGSPVTSRIAEAIVRVTEGLLKKPCSIAQAIAAAATKHGVDPMLIVAVGQTESSWRLDAVSPKGAVGPMQLMPSTFYALGGKNIYDWRENIDIGTKYLRQMIDLAGGDLTLALAYYHAGPSRPEQTVRRLSREYVARVRSHM